MDRHARVETSPERGEKAISENLAAKVSASLTTATAPPTTADWPWTTTKSRPPRLYKLRSHDYTIAFIVGFCFLTEVGIYVVYTPILPYHLRDLGYTNVESAIGYAASCYAAGLAVGAPIVGYLGQVFPSKRAILLVHFAVLASAIMLFLFVQTVAGMLVARTFQGLAGAGIWTIGMALLSDNTDRAYAGRLMGLAMLLFSTGNAASSTVSGSLYQALGWRAPSFYALGLIGVVVFLCLIFIEKGQTRPGHVTTPSKWAVDEEQGVKQASSGCNLKDDVQPQAERPLVVPTLGVWKSLTFILTHAKFLTAFSVPIWWGAFNSGINSTALTLRLQDRYHLTAQGVGNSFLAIALTSLVCQPLSGWLVDRLGCRRVAILCLSSFTLWSGCLCIDALPYPAFIALLVAIGASTSLVTTPIVVYLPFLNLEYGGVIGSTFVFGVWNFSTVFAATVFPIVVGQLMTRLGISLGWKLGCAIVGAWAGLTLVLVLRYMRLAPTTSAYPAPDNQVEDGGKECTVCQ